MGLRKWLQRRGTVGSIARHVTKQYQFIRRYNSEINTEDMCKRILSKRYELMPPLGGKAKRRYERVETEGLQWWTYDDLEKCTPLDVCVSILYIETGVGPLDGKIWDSALGVMMEVLFENGIPISDDDPLYAI